MGVGEDIADFLATSNLSTTVHVGELLPKPNSAVLVIPTAGDAALRTHGGSVMETRRIQVVARATDYPTVEALMTSAHGFLDGLSNTVINGRSYHWIEAIQDPFYLGVDEVERPMFVCNFNCLRAANT